MLLGRMRRRQAEGTEQAAGAGQLGHREASQTANRSRQPLRHHNPRAARVCAYLGVAHIIEQLVLAAGQLRHLVKGLLDQRGHRLARTRAKRGARKQKGGGKGGW